MVDLCTMRPFIADSLSSSPPPDGASPARVARQCPMRVASASATSFSSPTAASSGPRAHLRALGHRPRSLVPRRVPRDGTACPPKKPTRSHLPARAVLAASMETDGDASGNPAARRARVDQVRRGRPRRERRARVGAPAPRQPRGLARPGSRRDAYRSPTPRLRPRRLLRRPQNPRLRTHPHDRGDVRARGPSSRTTPPHTPAPLPRGVRHDVSPTRGFGRSRPRRKPMDAPPSRMSRELAPSRATRTEEPFAFIQYVATMAAVDAIQEAADQRTRRTSRSRSRRTPRPRRLGRRLVGRTNDRNDRE